MTHPSFYLKHLTQKLFILHRAKLLRISKLSFPNGLLFAFFVMQTFASLSVQLHKNSIKSAHFPKKYGKCADFMLLALCFKFNMVWRRITKRRSLFGRGKFYICKFGDSAWPIIITNGNFIEIWELLTKLLISPITDFNLFLFHHLSL